MIFIDANLVLRFLTGDDESVEYQMATQLFRQIADGAVLATTSEVVIHEVSYVLTSRRHYGLPYHEVIDYWRSMFDWPGWSFSPEDLAIYLRALDLWEEHPRLEFSDAVIAARCERNDLELASFDRHFDRLDHLRRWSPRSSESPP